MPKVFYYSIAIILFIFAKPIANLITTYGKPLPDMFWPGLAALGLFGLLLYLWSED
jgi:hypothetical protein